MLRPIGSDGRQGGHSTHDPLPTFLADLEAQIHDIDVLPHMHSKVDIAKMFSTIPAADPPGNAKDFIDARCYWRDIGATVDQ